MTPLLRLLALALLPLSLPATAAPTLVPAGLGPTPYLSHATRSWKAMRFDHVVRQETDFSCGAATLATIFNYAYGRHTTEQQVLVNMLKVADPKVVREKGFSLLDMKRYVQAVGMTGQGFKVPFDALAQLKVPAIALLDLKGYKHFVVVRAADSERVELADPALGNRTMSRADFSRSWNGILFVVLGKGFDPASALKNPAAGLTAARLDNERTPFRDALPQGFGPEAAMSVRF